MQGTRLSKQEAQDLLRHCLEDGAVIPSKHFRDELVIEGVTFVDAFAVLKNGNIYNEPEFHVGSGDWNYRVEGSEPGGKWLAIVLSFKAADKTFLVTVFSVEAKSKQTH